MIQSQWQVQKLDGPWAILAPLVANSSCCGPGAGCGLFTLTRIFGQPKTVKITNNQHLKEGSFVVLEVTESDFLKLTARVYILPLVFLVVGSVVGRLYGEILFGLSFDLGAILGGISGMMGSFVWLRYTARRHLALDLSSVRIRLVPALEPVQDAARSLQRDRE